MYFVHPYFFSSDRVKTLSQGVVISAVLGAAFRLYSIPLEKVPFIDVPIIWKPLSNGVPVLGISTMFVIVSIYLYIGLVGVYFGEWSSFNKVDIDAVEHDVSSAMVDRLSPISEERQKIIEFTRKQRDFNDSLAKASSFVRVFSDIILPSTALLIMIYFEYKNIIALSGYII